MKTVPKVYVIGVGMTKVRTNNTYNELWNNHKKPNMKQTLTQKKIIIRLLLKVTKIRCKVSFEYLIDDLLNV